MVDLGRRMAEGLAGGSSAPEYPDVLGSRDGRLVHVIEINPRFGGGFPLTWQAGGRYPRMDHREMLDLPSTVSDDGWSDRLLMLIRRRRFFRPSRREFRK